MPHEQVEPYEPPAEDYCYRVTAHYSDDVIPPAVPGEVSLTVQADTRASADAAVEVAVARTDLARILLEERLTAADETQRHGWHVIHSWIRTAEGWRHQ